MLMLMLMFAANKTQHNTTQHGDGELRRAHHKAKDRILPYVSQKKQIKLNSILFYSILFYSTWQ